MAATRCVPQTTHTRGKIYCCGDGQYYWKQQKGVPQFLNCRHMQTANDIYSYFKE